MRQRYTHFGQVANKTTIAKKHITKPEGHLLETTGQEVVGYFQTESASKVGPVLFVKENILTPIKANFQNTNTSVTKQDAKGVDNSKTEFKSKKTFAKNRSAAQRIVGAILKIVLWIIILAVVVGVILIIGALA
jgi:hypothetical protein